MNHILLTDNELALLLGKAEILIRDNKINDAQTCLNQVIKANSNNEYAYHLRASTWSASGNWKQAIKDMIQTIKLNPDDAGNYMNLGAYLTFQLFESKPHRLCEYRAVIEEILALYAECLKRDPADRTAWFNTAETHLFLRQWDDAIAVYAECKTYVTDKTHQVTHAWIGCLALALCGDNILEEDSKILYDQTIRFPKDFHDTSQVDYLLAELEDDNFDTNRLAKARHIHDEFLKHFDYKFVSIFSSTDI